MEHILEFSLQTKIALAKINKQRGSEFNYLKPLQAKSVKSALAGDSLIVLPTGYGKSLIFELVPSITKSRAIIVSPLNAIIEEQCQRLGDCAIQINATLTSGLHNEEGEGERTCVSNFRRAKYQYVIAHPEAILRKEICDVLRREVWSEVQYIFIGEAHCVIQWGQEFRPDFRNLSKLRANFPNAHLIALTATATPTMQNDIAKVLNMRNWITVSTSVDRPNVKIEVKRRLPSTGSNYSAEDSFNTVLQPIAEKLCKDPKNFPKTILYTKLKYCAQGYDRVCQEARETLFPTDIEESVSQYHAPCTEQMKKVIVHDMGDVSGKIKLLFATEAYGMGADAPDVRRIIHIGPPTSMETYIQEIGRAGRDGQESTATLYYNMSDIAKNTEVKAEVREFCLLNSCRRQYLCDHFGSSNETFSNHRCCDFCENKCYCDECIVDITEITEQKEELEHSTSLSKDLHMKQVLSAYFCAENEELCYLNPELRSGLTDKLADKIVENCAHYSSEQKLTEDFPFLSEHYVKNIIHLISTTLRL